MIDLISRNFPQDNIIFALEKVKKCPGFNDLVGEVKRRNPSDNMSATSAQAKDLVELLIKMAKETKLMRFVISCEDLNRATSIMGGLGVRDERAVSARLESLELGLRKLMDAVQQQGAGGRVERPQNSFTSVPKVVVTAPAEGSNTAAPAGGRRQGGRRPSQAGPRDLSPSQKRPRVEEHEARPREEESPWVKVVKKPRKTAVGKSNVNLEALGAGAEAGPIEIYISNTSNTTEEDDIKKVLETTAAGIDITANFKVTKAECLTKDANPRTKCWKVTVPFKFKEFMENDELYPSGWRYRKFFAARNVRNNTGAPARGRRQEKGGQASQVITREAMDTAMKEAREAMKRIDQLEAQALTQGLVAATTESIAAAAPAPAGGSEGAVTAQ